LGELGVLETGTWVLKDIHSEAVSATAAANLIMLVVVLVLERRG
jgi:hypothetical protein